MILFTAVCIALPCFHAANQFNWLFETLLNCCYWWFSGECIYPLSLVRESLFIYPSGAEEVGMNKIFLNTSKSFCANTQEAYRPRRSKSTLSWSGGGGYLPWWGAGTYPGGGVPTLVGAGTYPGGGGTYSGGGYLSWWGVPTQVGTPPPGKVGTPPSRPGKVGTPHQEGRYPPPPRR